MGRGAHYPPGAGCGVVLKGILIVLACLQFLGILECLGLSPNTELIPTAVRRASVPGFPD